MKTGEIVFDKNENVVDVIGYNNDRNSFEFIELSEYYAKVNNLEDLIQDLEYQIKEIKKAIKELT